MATRIDEIFAALADVDVIYGGAVVPSYYPTTTSGRALPESVTNSHTDPNGCRLLLPLGTRAEARSINPMVINGAIATIAWRITDLFLLKPVGRSSGLASEAVNLVNYMKAYFDALQLVAFQPLLNAQVESMAFEPTVTPFPADGDVVFFALEVSLTIKEIAQ